MRDPPLQRAPTGRRLAGLRELDVVGLNLRQKKAFLCEETTHLHGLRPQMLLKMPAMHADQKKYAAGHLGGFNIRYMVWSPRVTKTQAERTRDIGFR
jgi:hypothetical protein